MTARGRVLTKKKQFALYRDDDLNTLAPAGDVAQYTASGALLVGDLVYFSAARTVAKSNNAANHDKVAGVVVGGQALGANVILPDSGQVGTAAAADGQTVLVLMKGLAYIVVAAAIAAGVAIVADTTTAGRVKAATPIAGTVGTLAVTPAGIGTLAVSAPTKGTLAITAGATAVTSSAANGVNDITGAPAGGVLSGAPDGGVLSGTAGVTGEGNARVIGKVIDAGAGAASVVLAWINV